MIRSGENNILGINHLLCIVSLLFVTSVANASPTVTHQSTVLAAVCPADSPTTISGTIDIVKPVSAQLTNIGAEFLQPPASPVGLTNGPSNAVKPLPAVPAAMLMFLIGFLCVSLVRDRKIWLTALAGLFWAGQAGIQALPQLALRLGHANHSEQRPCTELTHPYCIENSLRLRSDIEDTRYIGLLHYLAGIPGADTACTNNKLLGCCYKHTHTFQTVILSEKFSLNWSLKCLVSETRQLICFSPAFIFAQLARGPPLPA